MQMLNAIIHSYRAFREFWHTHITTYTYVDLSCNLHTKSNANNLSNTNAFAQVEKSINTNDSKNAKPIHSETPSINSLYSKDTQDKSSLQHLFTQNDTSTQAGSIINSAHIDTLHNFKMQNRQRLDSKTDLDEEALPSLKTQHNPSKSFVNHTDQSKMSKNLNLTPLEVGMKSSIPHHGYLDSKSISMQDNDVSKQNLYPQILDTNQHKEISTTLNTDSLPHVHNNISSENKKNLDFMNLYPKTHTQYVQDNKIDSTQNISTMQYSADSTHKTRSKIPATITSLQYILELPYTTLAQLHNKQAKPHTLAKMLYCKRSMRMYYGILPLDYLKATHIEIEKGDLRQMGMLDSIVPLRAKNSGSIPYNYECRYFLQHQTQTHFNFQIFAIKDEILQHYASHYSGKLICLNPLEIFSSLFAFYPHLKRYTIIFQDSKKHALCHYVYGWLVVSIITDRTEALQDYYSLIDDFGEIFYCDFSGKADLLLDFKDITTLFNMPLKDCLHILALEHIRTKPTYTHFYAKAFYNMRSTIKMFASASVCIFAFYLSTFLYHKYEYSKFLHHEALIHSTQIDSLYHKKQQYPFMYERIYDHILETQSLNFCLQQDYSNTESAWIQMDCNKE